MGELLDGFCKLIKADEDVMSIAELMNKEEIQQWELLVKAFRDINVTTIAEKIQKEIDRGRLPQGYLELPYIAVRKKKNFLN